MGTRLGVKMSGHSCSLQQDCTRSELRGSCFKVRSGANMHLNTTDLQCQRMKLWLFCAYLGHRFGSLARATATYVDAKLGTACGGKIKVDKVY